MRHDTGTSVTVSGSALPERRGLDRQQLVLRVGILEDDKGTSFCLLRNISPFGVQVKVFRDVQVGSSVGLRVGDEDTVKGRLAWYRDRLAGISFYSELSPEKLLRVRQIGSSHRRRGSPRLEVATAVVLRSQGRVFKGQLCDISTSGARILISDALQVQREVTLEMDGLPSMKAYVRWSEDRELGLSFATCLPIQILAAWLGGTSKVSVC